MEQNKSGPDNPDPTLGEVALAAKNSVKRLSSRLTNARIPLFKIFIFFSNSRKWFYQNKVMLLIFAALSVSYLYISLRPLGAHIYSDKTAMSVNTAAWKLSPIYQATRYIQDNAAVSNEVDESFNLIDWLYHKAKAYRFDTSSFIGVFNLGKAEQILARLEEYEIAAWTIYLKSAELTLLAARFLELIMIGLFLLLINGAVRKNKWNNRSQE